MTISIFIHKSKDRVNQPKNRASRVRAEKKNGRKDVEVDPKTAAADRDRLAETPQNGQATQSPRIPHTDPRTSARSKALLGKLKARLAERAGITSLKSYKAAEAEVTAYRDAFETTATDRDRLVQELKASIKDKKHLEGERDDYRNAFETTAADRDRLAQELKASIKEKKHLESERDEYRNAFETTAPDRDRLAKQLKELDGMPSQYQKAIAERDAAVKECETYRNAFETTAVDRDHHKLIYQNLAKGLEALQASPSQLSLTPPAPPPTAERLLENKLIRKYLSQEELTAYSSKRVPNVYCVGAAKSGTSFFYSILREHPGIAMNRKDTGKLAQLAYTLNRDEAPPRRKDCVEQYLKMTGVDYSGEALLCNFDVGAILEPKTSKFIHDCLNPDARILLFLRDPVHRAVSEYVMRVHQFNPQLARFAEPLSFRDALEQESQREVATPHLYRMYHAYTKTSRYSSLIEPYLETFGHENVKVVIFEEEIVSNLESTILDTFAFLGLRDLQMVRLAGADHQIFADISRRPEEITVLFRDADGKLHDGEIIKDISAQQVARIEISSNVSTQGNHIIDNPSVDDLAAAQTLVERHSLKLTLDQERELYDRHFREDVTRLEGLLGRDLSIWYKRYE